MKVFRIIPLVFALSIVLLSCKKDGEDDPDPTQMQIVAVFKADQFVQNNCTELSGLRSSSGSATTVYFKNETAENLRIYWVNTLGALTQYQERLEPGNGRLQPTYLTHPWYIVTADEAEECIAIVTALRPAVTDTVYFRLQ